VRQQKNLFIEPTQLFAASLAADAAADMFSQEMTNEHVCRVLGFSQLNLPFKF
jgi:hypothetical protein